MADTTARPCYAGDTSAVEVKHIAQKGSAPHPEHDWATSRVGGATERRDDDYGDHGGAKIVGEGEPATAVIKMSRQQQIKYYSIETKP